MATIFTGVIISIHVPREGDDGVKIHVIEHGGKFQSTSPVRGTTLTWDHWKEFMGISIHVPREGDDSFSHKTTFNFGISIHVPREGDDGADQPHFRVPGSHFNPRPP